jgi:hypothetical protein
MKLVRTACFLLLAIVMLQRAAYAQETAAAGVLVGTNIAYFASSPKNETTKKNGLVIGAFAVLRKDKGLKILPEIQYSQRRTSVAFGNTDAEYSIDYLNLSLMTRLKLFKSVYTSQGLQFSLPLRATLDLGGSEADIKDNINKDISIPAGVGVQINKRFGIEGRWDSGLKRVEKGPLGNFIKRNRAITLFATLGI